MKLFNNIIGIFILIIFLVVSFYSGMKYNSNQKQNQDRKYYLNQIYFEIDNTIKLLSSVENWGGSINATDVTINPYRQLLARMNKMKIISEQAMLYFKDDINRSFLSTTANSFDLIEGSVGGGVTFKNQHICNDFLNDGVISSNEISFLKSFKEELQYINNGMYSEKTKQENPDLSMKDLSQIFKPFTDKYSISNLPNIGLKN